MSGIIKEIYSGEYAKKKLIEGVDIVADVVSSTMGYRGRTVLIEEDGGKNFPTKDGYHVLKSIILDNPLHNLACELLKEASQKTVDFAGDGTTATLVLAQAFVNLANEEIENGRSPIDVKLDIERSRDLILEFLQDISQPITNEFIYDVAKTSANQDESIAKIVYDAFISAGENGTVAHFRSNSDETFLEKIEGTLLDNGYADELFVNNPSDRTVLFENNPLVVLSAINFRTVDQIMPFIDFAFKNKREIVIVSDMEYQVRDVLLRNKLDSKLKVAVVTPPTFGQKRKDFLSDLALVCGTQMISTLSGDVFHGREADFLGTCSRVLVNNASSVFTKHPDTDIEKINGKINELKEQLNSSSNPLEKKYLIERIAKLSGQVSIIKVGAITESELKEKIDRVDDAVCAVRSAIEQGVVAGGGTALLHARIMLNHALDKVTREAISTPFFKILENASFEFKRKNWFTKKTKIPNYPNGIDVKNFIEVNMFNQGVIDATKVVKNSLINAVSVANTILMSDNVISLKRERNE